MPRNDPHQQFLRNASIGPKAPRFRNVNLSDYPKPKFQPQSLQDQALNVLKKQWWDNSVSPLELLKEDYPERYIEEYIQYIFSRYHELVYDKEREEYWSGVEIAELEQRLEDKRAYTDALERQIEHLRSGCDERIKKLQEENEMLEEEVLEGKIKSISEKQKRIEKPKRITWTQMIEEAMNGV